MVGEVVIDLTHMRRSTLWIVSTIAPRSNPNAEASRSGDVVMANRSTDPIACLMASRS
jgi:hypothetical protein